jgi:hypothetical protein
MGNLPPSCPDFGGSLSESNGPILVLENGQHHQEINDEEKAPEETLSSEEQKRRQVWVCRRKPSRSGSELQSTPHLQRSGSENSFLRLFNSLCEWLTKERRSSISSSTESSIRRPPLHRSWLLRLDTSQSDGKDTTPPARKSVCVRKGRVLLDGCTDPLDQRRYVNELLPQIRSLRSAEGLLAVGLEYRLVTCPEHTVVPIEGDGDDFAGMENEAGLMPVTETSLRELDMSEACTDTGGDDQDSVLTTSAVSLMGEPNNMSSFPSSLSLFSAATQEAIPTQDGSSALKQRRRSAKQMPCNLCVQRLFHIPTNTLITEENRCRFVADGEMYDDVSRLCQEYAHEVMCREGDLEWVTVEETSDGEPIRALVSRGGHHPWAHVESSAECDPSEWVPTKESHSPTLLLVTGRGKVRAGIFSRQHLMCRGLETSTAVHMIREAVERGMRIVVPDPNVHGERLGAVTFDKTMDKLFQQEACNPSPAGALPSFGSTSRDLYILAHSASGSHLALYLLERSGSLVQSIRAVAFTDSTHNIQWCNLPRFQNAGCVAEKLQGPECIYFKSSNSNRDGNDWYLHRAGDPVIPADQFWTHRFGTIRTCWAGTTEHSLTNWYAHDGIWNHFDTYLKVAVAPVRSHLLQ